ncbi:uncharacterized protein LOC143981489 [Lithobates pipiens]
MGFTGEHLSRHRRMGGLDRQAWVVTVMYDNSVLLECESFTVAFLSFFPSPPKHSGKVPEIFTRPGSDLLIPIRIRLTLNPTDTDTRRCDRIYWTYEKFPRDRKEIAQHRNCDPYDVRYLPNTRISENGSLIISNVTPENDGIYRVYIENSEGHFIQEDYYTVHVEGKVQEIFTRPGSDLLIPITRHLTLNRTYTGRCDWINWSYEKFPGDWKEIAEHMSCYLSDLRYFPNTRISENGSLIISNVTPENDGIYMVYIYNSAGHFIQRDYYFIHVEGKVQEIFTRPGSDLLIPIRNHLTLNRTDTRRCDRIIWYYEKFPGVWKRISQHTNCNPSDLRYFPNTRISENGSLIISNVTPENDGIYHVYIKNSTRHLIQRDDYFIHVEVPVSVPLLHVSCLRNGSAEISCRVEEGTKPNISLSVIGGSQERYSTSANNITAIVGSPGPWNITCTVENDFSQSEESRAGVTCPGEERSGDGHRAEIRSCWGHFLSSGAVFVLYTGLLIFMVNDLRKMKNEKNEKSRSERRTRRRDPMEVEMEMEPTYYNEGI